MNICLKTTCRVLTLVVLTLFLAGPFSAQNAPAGPNESLTSHLKWRNVGPANMVGRISDFEALDSDFTQVLVASASGGVFKSVNAGTTWEPIFDDYGSASIGDVAFFQKDANIIWVGTGEECPRNSIAWGDGIYKSTDGGKTFKRMGLETTQSIARILTHPSDPDLVYAAAPGHTWGYSGDRGLFKTTDGGKTWTKLAGGLPNDGKTGAIDLVMHPDNPDILFVAFWQRLRQPWRFDSGGPNGGIFKTTDGGKTWNKLTQGLPEGDLGRIGIAICRTKPDILMAVVEHGYQPRPTLRSGGQARPGMSGGEPNPDYEDMTKLGTGIYRSEDGGSSWKYMNRMNNRPFYYSHIYINPFEDEWVYFMTSSFNFSKDGGKTWGQIGGLHPDFHTMWLDPTNKNRFYVGQDGGASLTHDHGETWLFYDNLCFSQFYAVSADLRDPYHVFGGLQDNGTWGGPSMSREGSILTDFWYNIGGGDGFFTQNDPTDWRTIYLESQGGAISRVNIETRARRSIRPRTTNIVNYKDYFPPSPPAKKTPQAKPGQAAQQTRQQQRGPFRFNWSSPILISPHNPHTIYFGGNHLFKSLNRGDSWLIVSPDLSTNDPVKTDRNTGGITPDITGAETHCTIISVSESPLKPGLLWVGTDDGNIQITRDGGVKWTNVRPNLKGVPEHTWVSRVEASRFDEGTCYVTFDGHRSDDFHPYVFKTVDYGMTWTNITSNLPDGHCVYVIREDLINKNLLFVGTEFSVFFSRDGGKTWYDLGLNMPTVAFHDLVIHPRDNDLIAGTHGRGIWILDDITALRGATDTILNQDAALFEVSKPGTRWLNISRGGYGRGNLFFQGENPPYGALIHFYLKAKPAKPATLEIFDATGSLKTTYVLDDAISGLNRIVWDLRFDPPARSVENMISNLKRQIDTALKRPDITDDQKAELKKVLAAIEKSGANYRSYIDLQTRAYSIIRPGRMRFSGRGRGGAMSAEPGTYAVKLTVNGKEYNSKVKVRLDPIEAAAKD
jgi:photosystem II stability/assembly factor-like uncharacterized protein